MKKSSSNETLNHTLKVISKLLNNKCENFIFYGTLLGIVRENKLIKGDDDIDFYVNKKDRNKLIKILSNKGFDLNLNLYPNNTEYFFQINQKIDGKNIVCDFYFYDSESSKLYLEDKWNFIGNPNTEKNTLLVPKKLIFPLKKKFFNNHELFFPKHPKQVCKYLYGKNWKIPMKKEIEYKILIINGKPKQYIFKNNTFVKYLEKKIIKYFF